MKDNKFNNEKRSIAEFEPVKEIIFAWPKWYDLGYDFKFKRPMQEKYFLEVVGHLVKSVNVNILINNPFFKKRILSLLNGKNISTEHIRFSNIFTDSIWIGDYGPIFVEKNGSFEIVDFCCWSLKFRPIEDWFPTIYGLKNRIKTNYKANFNLALEGGNYLTDGKGTGFISSQIFEYNKKMSEDQIKFYLKQTLGLKKVIILEKEKTGGTRHVDMFIKLLNQDTILVGKYQDENDINYKIMETNVKTIKHNGYKVIRIPILYDPEKDFTRSYTNAVIINGTRKKIVFIPKYGIPQDMEVIKIYKKLMPEYEIISLDSTDISKGFGGIHCVLKGIPKNV